MKTKLIFILLCAISLLNGATLETDKNVYTQQELLEVTYSGMSGDQKDWIAIYPAGSSNDFANVITFHYTDGLLEDSETWNPLPVGDYEFRVFFRNSYHLETTHAFSVVEHIPPVTIATNKNVYLPNELLTVTYAHMFGDPKDWIAIYPAGASNDFANVITYHYTDGLISDTETWQPLPVGNYELRVFFKNSYHIEARTSFSVQEDVNPDDVALSLNKNTYTQNELVFVQYDNMPANNTDWIGIYPAGSSNAFANVIDWKYTKGHVSGELSLGGYPGDTELRGFTPMPGLAPGNYEVRAFFNNSLESEKVIPFTVQATPVVSLMYEDATGSISKEWIHVSGPYPPVWYNNVVRLKAKWINNHTNTSEYILPFAPRNATDKVLELDVGGQGRWTPHFSVGVLVQTTLGYRRMLWDSFMNHYNVPANKDGVVLKYPTYVELQRNTANDRKHFRVNIEKYLRILEPNNKLLSVNAFFATGGDLDNIKLSSH